MAAVDSQERLSVLEVRVDSLKEDILELKADVKEVHDCIDRTREELKTHLQAAFDDSTKQHDSLTNEIREIKKWKEKWMYLIAGGTAALGWASGHSEIVKNLF